jgi:hypothetical protein
MRAPFVCGSTFCVVAIAALALTGCRQAEETRSTASVAQSATDTPPASLEMGGSKSVTRFFVTSRGAGHGGNLGGLAGADAHCQALAMAQGSGDHTWRAYLSTAASNEHPAVNARDRIGKGPWYNALGDRVAIDLDDLHRNPGVINAGNALTETGDELERAAPDVLTGSQPDGTAYPPGADNTCGGWTSGGAGHARLGRVAAVKESDPRASWNSAQSSAGCGVKDLRSAAGGRFYCFATD